MKILILSQYYPPEHGAPQNRLHDLALKLTSLACEVSVLTAMPNYPKGQIFPEYSGKIFACEEIDGIKVFRSWIFATKSKTVPAQLASYFSFVLSSLITGLIKAPQCDFIICESPPIFLGMTAFLLSIFKGAKMIMNISDLWPESAVQLGILKRGFVFKVLESFELFLYRRSVFVSGQTEGIIADIKSRISEVQTVLFPNGVDLDMFKNTGKDDSFRKNNGIPENAFLVGYAGNHGRSQALRQIIDAAIILKAQGFFFAFFGDGPEKNDLIEYAQKNFCANVKFFSSFPRTQMPYLLSQFDLAIVPLKNIPLFDGARPSKIFELMACGTPFIFCGRGEGAEIALDSGNAAVVPPEEPYALVKEIENFANLAEAEKKQRAQKSRKFVEERFDRQKIALNFFSELQKSIKGKKT